MTSWYSAFLVIIVVWVIGVVALVLWIFGKVVPDVRKLLDATELSEEEKQMRLIRTMFPPRFSRED